MHRRAPIRRLLVEGLAPGPEARLKAHLRRCPRCRRVYAEEQALLRALAGEPSVPTAAEDARLVDAVLAAAAAGDGPAPAPAAPREGRLSALVDRLLWLPGPALAAAALVLLAVGITAGLTAGPGPVVARIARGQGLTLDGRAVAVGDAPLPLHAGEPLAAAPGGLAVLELARPGQVRVYPGTRLTVGRGGRDLDLGAGRVWCRIPEGHGGFTVRTGDAVIEDLGTSFVVAHQHGHGTSVRVMSGTVAVRGRHRRRTVKVEAHQETEVHHGDDPAPPSRYDPARDRLDWAALWHRFLDSLRDALEKVRHLFH